MASPEEKRKQQQSQKMNEYWRTRKIHDYPQMGKFEKITVIM